MRIVFVSRECPPSLRSSGIGSYVWETGRALAEIGHNVTIIAAADDGELTSSTPSPRMTVIRLPDDERAAEKRNIVAQTLCAPLDLANAYRRRVAECIGTLIEGHHPDIIEFPGFRGESLTWLGGPRLLPMVVRMHGFTAGIYGTWKDHASASRRLQLSWECQEMRAADLITVVAEHLAPSVRARFGADRVRVVHNSIDSARWAKLSGESPQEVGPSDILFVGSLLKKKGIFTLLGAAKALRETGWRGRLVLVGRRYAPFERFLRLRAALGMSLPDWVLHLGMCQRERLAGLYRNAGVCCLPSLLEPFPYTCLEAMASGGIVVGSLRTGMAEIITETSGFLVPPGDFSRLAGALASVLAMSAEQRARISEAAQQRIRDHFDHAIIIPELLKVYSETINSYRARC
jgi:glycosyltransferase involved in cell wall biosynthesis